jgi:hypothetical protein
VCPVVAASIASSMPMPHMAIPIQTKM